MSKKFRVAWLEALGNETVEYTVTFETNTDYPVEAVPSQFAGNHRKDCDGLIKVTRVEVLD
jgi:hypothetical protein